MKSLGEYLTSEEDDLRTKGNHSRTILHQSWSRDEDAQRIPKYQLPKVGIPSRSAYQLIHDEMLLDGNPTLNLASFVHTWMPEEATKLILENLNKYADYMRLTL